MKCNKCGFDNPDTAKFCNWCGEKLGEETGQKKCQICGSENDANAKYCAICGSQLSSVNYQPSNAVNVINNDIYAKQEDKFGKTSMIVGIVSLATTVLCCLFPLGIIGGIVSVIFAILSIKKGGGDKGSAIAGLICGGIAFALGLLTLISIIAVMNDPEYLEMYKEMLEQYGYY